MLPVHYDGVLIAGSKKMSGGGGGGRLVSIYPEELVFEVELEKPSYCNIMVVNRSEHHVAFKVKTTSPKKYFVRPNTSVVQPWDSCTITVTLQPQKELPPDLHCMDKFLIQSTRVPPTNEFDVLPPDTFNKEGDKVLEEMKLKVVYASPGQSSLGNSEDDSTLGPSTSRRRGVDSFKNSSIEETQTIQRLKEEKDATLQSSIQLQRELEFLKRRRSRRTDAGFSFMFAAFAGLIGIVVGFILRLTLS